MSPRRIDIGGTCSPSWSGRSVTQSRNERGRHLWGRHPPRPLSPLHPSSLRPRCLRSWSVSARSLKDLAWSSRQRVSTSTDVCMQRGRRLVDQWGLGSAVWLVRMGWWHLWWLDLLHRIGWVTACAHVCSFWSRVPMYVGAGGQVWTVDYLFLEPISGEHAQGSVDA